MKKKLPKGILGKIYDEETPPLHSAGAEPAQRPLPIRTQEMLPFHQGRHTLILKCLLFVPS